MTDAEILANPPAPWTLYGNRNRQIICHIWPYAVRVSQWHTDEARGPVWGFTVEAAPYKTMPNRHDNFRPTLARAMAAAVEVAWEHHREVGLKLNSLRVGVACLLDAEQCAGELTTERGSLPVIATFTDLRDPLILQMPGWPKCGEVLAICEESFLVLSVAFKCPAEGETETAILLAPLPGVGGLATPNGGSEPPDHLTMAAINDRMRRGVLRCADCGVDVPIGQRHFCAERPDKPE